MGPINNNVGDLSFGTSGVVSNKEKSQGLSKTSKEETNKNLERIKKYAVGSTVMLPFSSRSIAVNVLKTPLRFFQSLGLGIKAAVSKSEQGFSEIFSSKMQEFMKKDWVGGIEDRYKDLSTTANKEKGKALAKENIRYAGYINEKYDTDDCYLEHTEDKIESRASWKSEQLKSTSGLQDKPGIKTLFEDLKKIGFTEDKNGHFYDVKTGTIFTMTFDEKNKEITMNFTGLGTENRLNPSADLDNDKLIKDLSKANTRSALKEFFGGVPKSATQAKELGEALKKAGDSLEFTPIAVGHSHGGGIAQIAAAANDGVHCVAFNPRPVGASVRRWIGSEKVAKNAENMKVFSSKGDFLTGTRAINFLSVFCERVLGIPVPRSIGTGYQVPHYSPHKGNPHTDILEQMYEMIPNRNNNYS